MGHKIGGAKNGVLTFRELDFCGVHFEDVMAGPDVRHWDINVSVKASRADQGPSNGGKEAKTHHKMSKHTRFSLVKRFGKVSCSNDNHPFQLLVPTG